MRENFKSRCLNILASVWHDLHPRMCPLRPAGLDNLRLRVVERAET